MEEWRKRDIALEAALVLGRWIGEKGKRTPHHAKAVALRVREATRPANIKAAAIKTKEGTVAAAIKTKDGSIAAVKWTGRASVRTGKFLVLCVIDDDGPSIRTIGIGLFKLSVIGGCLFTALFTTMIYIMVEASFIGMWCLIDQMGYDEVLKQPKWPKRTLDTILNRLDRVMED